MQNKKVKHSYNGMVKDTTKSQFPQNFYFEGKNIRIVATDSQSTGSITNEKGNSLIATIPTPQINYTLKTITYGSKTLSYTTNEINYTNQSVSQEIIGHSNSRDYLIIFTTDNNGFDCIWKMDYVSYDLTLLYLRNMSFSKLNPISTVNNFENKNVDKVYWIDNKSQMRFINIFHSIVNEDIEELIDVSVNVIDMVGKYNLGQPIISNITTGGKHTSGMIQYGYNLYRLNSSQTKISPLSELIPLDKGTQGGGGINESVGAVPIIDINNIDGDYTHIRVYAIKYTSYNEIPAISIIEDSLIPSSRNIQIFDDGNVISTLSLEELIFLGSDIVIPSNINSKNNRLFFSNYKEINFDVTLDTRAYGFSLNGVTTNVYRDVFLNTSNQPDGIITVIDNTFTQNEKYDSINLDYEIRRYQYGSNIQGGEGKYLKYTLQQSTTYNKNNRYFKDDEIYRLGIQFFNKYGQKSNPKWVADFKAPSGNLKGLYNTLKVEFKPEFITWLSTSSNFKTEFDKPVGFKVLIADRTSRDKTIVANGLISPMMVNLKTSDEFIDDKVAANKTLVDVLPKLPNILVRNCNASSIYGITKPLERCLHLKSMSQDRYSNSEIQRAHLGNIDTAGRFYQFNSLMQLYSPEIMFEQSQSLSEGLKLKIKGGVLNVNNNAWTRAYRPLITPEITDDGKAIGGLSPWFSTSVETTVGDVLIPTSSGLLGHPRTSDPDRVSHQMFSRNYSDSTGEMITNSTIFTPAVNKVSVDVYGKPEFTEKGQNFTTYNNDTKYRYTNSLESFYSDGNTDYVLDGIHGRKLVSVNSYGNRCVTFALDNTSSVSNWQRTNLETLFLNAFPTPLNLNNQGIIAEFVKSDNEIYLGNIYGGNSYEDKKRSSYIEIGNYKNINAAALLNTMSVVIDSPGDTFVSNFKFLRITNTDKSIFAQGVPVYQEIVEVLCETTVDLRNRNDLSFSAWDSKFQYPDKDYHKYNRVYSQTPNLIKNRDFNFNTKKLNNLDTNIIVSKLKSPGEIIDNWTDILQNEVLTLDGKYGPINMVANFNDQLYAIQDRALSFISISPRIQVQGSDGLNVELGSGAILQEYRYISTESGTLNRWSVVVTPNGIYYYDLLNKSVMQFSSQLQNISNIKNMHSYFITNTDAEELKVNNPIIKQGISSGFDQINNDVFMTFHKNVEPFTISYNEKYNQFVSFYDYIPSIYISRGKYLFTTNPNLKSLYRQYEGEYNKFYEQYYPSYVILNINPESDLDTVFDNIMYKSEVYLNDIDQPDKTLTDVRLYSEYQNSGLVPLIIGRNSNLRRKFRDWNAILPRNQSSRQRIRNPWVKLLLRFDNRSNYKMILHDVIISYSV